MPSEERPGPATTAIGDPAGPIPQRLVMILPNSGEHDTRAIRIATGLAARGHAVTIVARWADGLPLDTSTADGYRVIRVPIDARDGLPLPRALRSRAWRGGRPTGVVGHNLEAVAAIRAASRPMVAASPRADLVHGEAFMAIRQALAVGRRDGAPVVYDALDLYTDAGRLATLPRPVRRAVGRIEGSWARSAAAVTSANDAYADVQAERFGRRPVPIYNGSLRFDARAVDRGRFQRALGLPADRRIVLYHGGLVPHRGVEQLMAAITLVPNATLVCLGYGGLAASLEATAASPELGDLVRVMPAVPPGELLGWVAAADVAAMPIQPTTLNHRLTTPNKLFEAMSAGVPVLASDLPGMASVVRATGAGLLVDPTDPTAIAARLREMLDAAPAVREGWSRAGLEVAAGPYGWARQLETLIGVYSGCTGRPW